MQYKERGDAVSSQDEESSFWEKSAGNLRKKVSPKAHKLSD
jgi:hypothetical protein